MIEPKPLFPGARVALVGPASAVPEEKLQPALDLVRQLGMEPVPYPSCYFANRDGYFAASDTQRGADINRAFADQTIDGIWCIRGGYGAHRILPLLDAELIRRNPKWFGGYSDVTALHTFLNQVCGLVTYHCTMPSTEPHPDDYTLGYLKKALFGGLTGSLSNPEGQGIRTLVPGQAEGVLCGGNLSLLAASLGTPWEIETKGKLLFLEDIGEKTYRIDSMLTQLRNAGKFRDCAGILLGAWTDCVPEMPERTLTLDEIFAQLIVPTGKPAVMNVACGHCATTMALPMGGNCRLDADKREITLEGV
ncbi:MAG: LD-carboxypeptidase [Firmicutes bacterium]|nr:LD-carboxypeptidase [Bacillota bacterium]